MNSITVTRLIMSICMLFIISQSMTMADEKKISKKEIPAAVLSAFQAKYPNAIIKGQALETENGINYYEIESVDGKINRDLLYTADGKIREIEETMDINSLPAKLKKTLEKEYPSGKIIKAEKVTRDSTITYDFQIKVGEKTMGVTLNASGKILKAKKEDTEKEENEDEEEEEEDEGN